jgi:hypothetical protein
MLQSELAKDGKIDPHIMAQLCTVFEGACSQAKASRIRPSTPAKELFTAQEFEWFSKNAYNLSLKYCAEVPPNLLVRLLDCCTEVSLDRHFCSNNADKVQFIKLLIEKDQSTESDLCLRLVFCEFLAACTYTTLARAEDNTAESVSRRLFPLMNSVTDWYRLNTIWRRASTVKSSDAPQRKGWTNSVGPPKLTSCPSTSRLSNWSLKPYSSSRDGTNLTNFSINAGSIRARITTRHWQTSSWSYIRASSKQNSTLNIREVRTIVHHHRDYTDQACRNTFRSPEDHQSD